MTQKQHPIGSGFTAASTTDEVIAGIDLSGRNVVVTGGHVGLGLETTRALSRAGASVTVGVRNPDRAAPALAGIERVEISQLDLLDPSVDRRVRRPVPRLGAAVAHPRQQRRHHGRAAAARCPRLRSAVRDQPPRPLPTDPRPAARAAGRSRRPRRRSVVLGASPVRHPLGRPAFRDRLRRHGRLRPGEDRQRAVRRRAGPPVGGRRHPGLLATPGPDRRHQPGPMARRARTARDGPHRRLRSADHRPGP